MHNLQCPEHNLLLQCPSISWHSTSGTVTNSDYILLKRQVEILRSVQHKHVVKLLDIFDTKFNVYILMELAPQ